MNAEGTGCRTRGLMVSSAEIMGQGKGREPAAVNVAAWHS
jgi:hypothetical protein